MQNYLISKQAQLKGSFELLSFMNINVYTEGQNISSLNEEYLVCLKVTDWIQTLQMKITITVFTAEVFFIIQFHVILSSKPERLNLKLLEGLPL